MTRHSRLILGHAVELGAANDDPELVRRVKRRLAQSDLFFLLVYVLGRADLNRDWYFARCREVQAGPNGYLDLWGREHGKSSLITFGLTIQDILNDPEITVGIFSYSRPIAKAFLRQIKTEFESNEMLRALFPDILWADPQRDAPKWSSDDGIIVRRKGAAGVGEPMLSTDNEMIRRHCARGDGIARQTGAASASRAHPRRYCQGAHERYPERQADRPAMDRQEEGGRHSCGAR
jgi:hypothetical protein